MAGLAVGVLVGLGLTALAKGVGFGAALVGVAVVLVLAWDRDRRALRRLRSARGGGPGPGGSPGAGLAGPGAAPAPAALGLWAWHVADRLAERPEQFAGEPWWEYGPALLGQVLPWTPLALAGAGRSLARAVRRRDDPAAGADGAGRPPALGLGGRAGRPALAGDGQAAHYTIHALPPWSIWAALGLTRLGGRLERRGWSPARLRRVAWSASRASGWPAAWASRCSARGSTRAGGSSGPSTRPPAGASGPGEPLALLYDDWDRLPYPTPFGPVPHDLGVRLFYLDRPACWRFGVDELAEQPPASARGAPSR